MPRLISRVCLPALLALALLAGCVGAGQPTANPVDPSLLQPAPPTQPPLDESLPANGAGVKLVAKVNGQEITFPQFEAALERRQLEVNAASFGALQADVLDQLIQQALIQQGAAAQQLAVGEEQVQAELQAMKDAAGSPESWTEWLEINKFTEADFTRTLHDSLITNLVRDSLTTDLNGNVRQVHARHILLNTEAEAQSALARLQAGEDFAAVAAAVSRDDTTRESGGDLGWFTQDELLVPELAGVAFGLQPQQLGGPVTTELGYHIVQTLEFADRPVDPERRVFIAQTRFENWLRALIQNAVIERYLRL